VKILANENFPQAVVRALRGAGHDVLWARKEMPGASDEDVMARAAAEQRLLLTFDTDFADRHRGGGTAGCIIGGFGGYAGASTLASGVYDWAQGTFFTPLPQVSPP